MCHIQEGNVYRILVRNLTEGRRSEDLGVRTRQHSIEMVLRGTELEGVVTDNMAKGRDLFRNNFNK